MANTGDRLTRVFQAIGLCSPYIAVLVGVFIFKNIFPAVLFYHAVLLICITGINKSNAVKLLYKGYHGCIGPLVCLGGLLPGIVIIYCWPVAKPEEANLSELFSMLSLNKELFAVFAVYACLINPFLEESFWRGCFKSRSVLPTPVDALFAGYHAIAVYPAVKPVFAVFLFFVMTFVGWLFRYLYNFTGGLLIPLLTHIIADIAILYAFWMIMQ